MGQLSLFAGAVALPGEFGAVVRVAVWRGSLPLGGAQAVWAVVVIVGGRGWEDECGLPVTPSARGMKARKFSLARGPDLRVASCCR